MSNLLDYIVWRGDLSFEQDKINILDKLIFSRISYLPFSEINFIEGDTIEKLNNKFGSVDSSKYLWLDDIKMIELIGHSNRYKNLKITDYDEKFDASIDKQFAAITIQFSDDLKIISYRGTDSTIVGWKEDFNLSFMTDIPSQIEALGYLNRVSSKYSNSKFLIVGHSKGGNIGIYSSIYCSDEINSRIVEIVNADGPGIDQNALPNSNYDITKNRIKTYIPKTSVIGRILETSEDFSVIESTGNGIMQHDIYTWEVGPTFLIELENVDKSSEISSKIIKEWLNSTNPEDKKLFINIIFEAIYSSGATSTKDLVKNLIVNSKKITDMYKNIKPEDKAKMEEMFKLILELSSQNIKNEINSNISENIKLEKQKRELEKLEKEEKKQKQKLLDIKKQSLKENENKFKKLNIQINKTRKKNK